MKRTLQVTIYSTVHCNTCCISLHNISSFILDFSAFSPRTYRIYSLNKRRQFSGIALLCVCCVRKMEFFSYCGLVTFFSFEASFALLCPLPSVFLGLLSQPCVCVDLPVKVETVDLDGVINQAFIITSLVLLPILAGIKWLTKNDGRMLSRKKAHFSE